MNTEELEQPPSTKRNETNRPYFSLSDLFFMVIAGALGISIAQLGYATWVDARHTESAKASGESMVSWMTDAAKKRTSSGDGSLSECGGEEKNWLDCREWLVSSSGPFRGLSNQISRSNKVFSPACDRTQLDTLGSIIFEKGTPKPPDGASLMYAPLADDEPLSAPLALRLSICGRGFSVIRIAEFTF